MRIELIKNRPEEFAAAIPRPAGTATKANYGGYVTKKLEIAAAEQLEQVSFQSIGLAEKNSENFQNVAFIEAAIMDHIKTNEYPKSVRIVCDSDEIANMYYVVYNFYYAGSKDARIEVQG